MAGKVDSSTHAAAVAKISEAAKHEAELRAHLEEIVRGAAFRGSHRSQIFLKHIVEQALHGDASELRRNATFRSYDDRYHITARFTWRSRRSLESRR